MDKEYKYFAFISYNHNDKRWGKWLIQTLERFHLPASLNGRDQLPKNLRPIFRDEEELSAGDLPEQIKTALDNSKNLIVICSPNSATSKWVNDEILHFKESGRLNKVFPFIVEGNPETSFPASLLNLNPHEERLGGSVVDSGKQNATLKIIAGMLGVKFDELKQRARRYRIIKSIILSLIAILVLAIILLVGNVARKAHVKNLMENAAIAYEKRDLTTYANLACKAYSWDFHSEQTRALLLKASAIEYSMPIKLASDRILHYNARTHEFFDFDSDKKLFDVRDRQFHKTGEQICFNEAWYYPISSSRDGLLLAIPDYDSVYVYDRGKREFIFSTPFDGGWQDNLGEIVFDVQGRSMVRMRPNDVLIHNLEEKTTTTLTCHYDKLFLSDSNICLARVISDSLIIDRLDPVTSEISVLNKWGLPTGSSEYIQESLTVSPTGKELVAWTGTSVLCFSGDGIEYIVFSDRKPLMVNYDSESERFAIVHEGGGFVQVFRSHRLEYGLNKINNKPINGVCWGRDEDLILDCGDCIYVYNHVSNSEIALDASMCPGDDYPYRVINCNDDYIFLLSSEIASQFAAFTYPNQEWVTTRYSSPEYVSEYFHSSSNDVGESFDYTDIDRRVVCEKDKFIILSLSDNRTISEITYPSFDPLVNVSRDGHLLFCNLRHFLPSDIGSVKGFSNFLLIDLENGKQVSDYSRMGSYNHMIDSGSIILSQLGNDGAVIKLEQDTLNPVDSLFLGEFITMPPIKCADGSFLSITIDKHLFRYDFSKHSFEIIPLPLPAADWGNYIFDERYLELFEVSEDINGKYLYDLKTKSLVMYLLPHEFIISVDGDTVQLENYSNNQRLSYTRKLLNKRNILKEITRFPNDWD